MRRVKLVRINWAVVPDLLMMSSDVQRDARVLNVHVDPIIRQLRVELYSDSFPAIEAGVIVPEMVPRFDQVVVDRFRELANQALREALPVEDAGR